MRKILFIFTVFNFIEISPLEIQELFINFDKENSIKNIPDLPIQLKIDDLKEKSNIITYKVIGTSNIINCNDRNQIHKIISLLIGTMN